MNLYALQLCRNLYACITVFSMYFYLSGNSTEPTRNTTAKLKVRIKNQDLTLLLRNPLTPYFYINPLTPESDWHLISPCQSTVERICILMSGCGGFSYAFSPIKALCLCMTPSTQVLPRGVEGSVMLLVPLKPFVFA